MSTRPAASDAPPSVDRCPGSEPEPHGRLMALARVLVDATDHVDGPTLVRAADDGEDLRLGLLPVPDGLDPLDLLLGARTPDEWDTVGVVASGRLVDVDGATTRPDGDDRGRVRLAVLVDRDGAMASIVQPEHGPQRALSSPPDGRFADALRRSLGLETPPPDTEVSGLVPLVWLHRVHSLAADGRPPDADVAAALRPPMPRSWTDLRHQCAQGGWSEIGCEPELAAWMDDGMFSRWCLGSFPDPVELLVDLSELVGTDATGLLAEGLRTWR